jgi:hypothetical protein
MRAKKAQRLIDRLIGFDIDVHRGVRQRKPVPESSHAERYWMIRDASEVLKVTEAQFSA